MYAASMLVVRCLSRWVLLWCRECRQDWEPHVLYYPGFVHTDPRMTTEYQANRDSVLASSEHRCSTAPVIPRAEKLPWPKTAAPGSKYEVRLPDHDSFARACVYEVASVDHCFFFAVVVVRLDGGQYQSKLGEAAKPVIPREARYDAVVLDCSWIENPVLVVWTPCVMCSSGACLFVVGEVGVAGVETSLTDGVVVTCTGDGLVLPSCVGPLRSNRLHWLFLPVPSTTPHTTARRTVQQGLARAVVTRGWTPSPTTTIDCVCMMVGRARV